MAILNILHYPDPQLRKKAEPVAQVDDGIRKLVSDMFDTMYHAPGVGLAAVQVNVHQRVIVIDISEDKSDPICLINPEIIEKDGKNTLEEGCLSVPGIYEKVDRAEHIKVRALDRDGESYEVEANGLLSICIQHEMDHLDGKLFVDYLSQLKRTRIRKKMEKMRQKTL